MICHSIFLNFGPSSPPPPPLMQLIQENYPEAQHPGRLAGLYSSRHSLWENLRKFDDQIQYHQLGLKNYSELREFPQLVISLSHSSLAGASVVASRQEYLSVGIDIEVDDRPIKEEIITKVTTPLDMKLSALSTWCLKEAIYKCVANSGLYGGVLEFRDMVIGDHGWNHSPSGLHGEWIISLEKGHHLAVATLKSQSS